MTPDLLNTSLAQIHDGSISFEEKRGKIFVHMADPFGDGHIHLLNYEGVSKANALEILKAKQEELERARAEHSVKPQIETASPLHD
jgi:hypothetical protein